MNTLSIDLETYSEIDIKKCGAYRYAADPSFEVMLFAYSVDYGPVTVIDLMDGVEIPLHIQDAIFDPKVLKTAFNANFERVCLAKHFGKPINPAQWECTMVLAAQIGLPLSLEAVSSVMRLDKAKMKEGKDLIRYFCVPCKPTKVNGGRTRNMPEDSPEKWSRFVEYNRRDVEVENHVRQALQDYRPGGQEHHLWCIDQKINDMGVPVDLTLVRNAIDFDQRFKATLEGEAIALSGLDNPNSVSQVKTWLKETEGVEVESLNKKAMPEVMEQVKSDEARDFLEIRKELSKSSTKKYDAILRSVCPDGKIRGLFQFYGANRTGRSAGRLVQVQNLPQNHLPDLEVARSLVRNGDYEMLELLYGSVTSTLSELIRTALVPEPGCRFIVSDFSAIEARVIAWFAGEEWVLEEFRNEGKIYEATAANMFGIPKELIKKGNPEYEYRQKGKVAALALGYQGGANALIAMGALNAGIAEEELPTLVQLWRRANKHIVRWWASLEEAAFEALENGRATDGIGLVTFRFEDGHLFMDLPSGRSLCYYHAKLGKNRFGNPSIHYEGMNQVTKKWETQDTYGGKLAENAVQGTARDLLMGAIDRLDQVGFDIRMHIHDEVVINEPIGGRTIEEVCEIMGQSVNWAEGLPLRADGYETAFYRKD